VKIRLDELGFPVESPDDLAALFLHGIENHRRNSRDNLKNEFLQRYVSDFQKKFADAHPECTILQETINGWGINSAPAKPNPQFKLAYSMERGKKL
jgi:hypothetical protein